MSDEQKRRAERDALTSGDLMSAARANNERNRAGEGLLAWLEQFVGQWVYAETYKMNYRGVLKAVLSDSMAKPTGLLFSQLSRVGDWSDQPNETYEETMSGERYLAWDGVCEFGAQQAHWPKTLSKPGPKQ